MASVDRDEDATVRYEMTSGNEEDFFTIDNDGKLECQMILVYDTHAIETSKHVANLM